MSEQIMFNQKSFEVFDCEGLEARMEKIRSEIQPVFQALGEKFLEFLNHHSPETTFYLHIAQHRRRTTHAPENTWSAISTQKRGYKMEAHFQLGIWHSYVFLYLSLIDQPKNQENYAKRLKQVSLPENFVVSKDHTQEAYFPSQVFSDVVNRLEKVKKSELECGRIWKAERFDGKNDERIFSEMLKTMADLLPIYDILMKE